MQQSNRVKAMLLSAAAVGLGSVFASSANAASAFTWAGLTTGGTQTWSVAANWSQTDTTYPQNAGDTAKLNVAIGAAQTVLIPGSVNVSLGTLLMGSGFNQIVWGSGTTLTLSNGANPAYVVQQSTGSSIMDVIGDAAVTSSGPVVIAMNAGGAKAFNLSNGTFDVTNTVTIQRASSTSTTPQIYINEPATASLWVVASKAKMTISGPPNCVAGDVTINAHAYAQCLDSLSFANNVLLTNNGTMNFGTQPETLGGMAGTGVINGVNALTIAGGTDVGGVSDWSGALYETSVTVNGGTQRLSAAVTNGSGVVTVNGGVLQLNNSAGYALSTTYSCTGNVLIAAGSLTINTGGTVQLLLGQQIDPTIPITLAGGKLALGQNSQTSNMPLVLTAGSTIDFGTGLPASGNAVLQFADSSNQVFSGITDILDWNGKSSGGGTDIFYIGATNDLTAGDLADLKFINPIVNGVQLTGTFGAIQLSSGEVVPVPEPATLGLLAIGTSMLLRRRRRN